MSAVNTRNTSSTKPCPELDELGRAWLMSPGCGMYQLVWEHRQSCPACLEFMAAIEARRAEREKGNAYYDYL
jgi:hypothetical protein